MPGTHNLPHKRPGRWRFVSRRINELFGRAKTPDWHWFDHPEMQARIAEAEADLREGRFEHFDSREEAMAYIDRQS